MRAFTSPFPAGEEPRYELLVRHREESWNVALEPHVEFEVGRAESVRIRLDADAVGERHLRIQRRDDGVFVTDLGSTSGTWLVRRAGVGGTPGGVVTDAMPQSNRRCDLRLTTHICCNGGTVCGLGLQP